MTLSSSLLIKDNSCALSFQSCRCFLGSTTTSSPPLPRLGPGRLPPFTPWLELKMALGLNNFGLFSGGAVAARVRAGGDEDKTAVLRLA